MISWRTVRDNKLTIDQLSTFEGGIVVEFVNNDFFDDDNKKNLIFDELIHRLGSDEIASSVITIRSEGGNSSSAIPSQAFEKLVNNTEVSYNGEKVMITENNFRDWSIKQIISGGIGNEKWSGFLYVSIRGGQQDTIETHKGQKLTLFNPACEYASSEVGVDMDLVMAYFAMLSIPKDDFDKEQLTEYKFIENKLVSVLKSTMYDSDCYKGNLFDYCNSHYSVRMINGQLTDPIQIRKIDISAFNKSVRDNGSVDFTHNEAVINNKYYWDNEKKCILSPARPTNVFWSYHLSNMMQQDFGIDVYFDEEEKRVKKRRNLLKSYHNQ